VSGLLIGYARVSTDMQDLHRPARQRQPSACGRANRHRPRLHRHARDRSGLRDTLAACRAGDTLIVTKLDRLARSLPDARDIVDDLTRRQVKLNLGGSVLTEGRGRRSSGPARPGRPPAAVGATVSATRP
jgi:DNA invertase Pin-like site-specific DNA recombinase